MCRVDDAATAVPDTTDSIQFKDAVKQDNEYIIANRQHDQGLSLKYY